MRVAVFRHAAFEHLGLIADALSRAGLAYEYIDMADGVAPASISDYAALISMGGPMSANDDLPFLDQEIACIREAVAGGKPVLGVCLGAQLVAKALGARVYPNAVKEIGWFPVHWTGAAENDPLFGGFREPETVFHWHGETFDLPEGAGWLAWSEECRHQAFRFGSNVYGLQFHLEVTPEMIEDWMRQPSNRADVGFLPAPIDPGEGGARLTAVGKEVFGRWCALTRTDY